MILAKITIKIASDGSDGIGVGGRINMKEWFFFNGINVLGNQCSINQRVKNAVSVFPHSANAPPVRLDRASMRA
jgi:hypothetical protein